MGDAGVVADGDAVADGTEKVVYVHAMVVQNAGEDEDEDGVSAESAYVESVESVSAKAVVSGYDVAAAVEHDAEGVARVEVAAAVAAGAAIDHVAAG